MPEPDELYTLRNHYWLGNFQLAINEASALHRVPAKLVLERDEYLYRSYTALGQFPMVLSEIKDTASVPISLRAIRLQASVLANPNLRDNALQQLKEWLSGSDAAVQSNMSLRLTAATMFAQADQAAEALKLLGVTNAEHLALRIQLYLRIDRSDLASASLAALKRLAEEDSVIYMLANSWVNIAAGTVTGAQEAVYALEELADKHGASGRVLVAIAVAYMHLAEKGGAPATASGSTNGLYEEAEAKLQEALIKVPQDPDALANLVVVSQHLGRAPEVVSRYLSQLRLSDAHHPLVVGLSNFENAFDRVAVAINV